MNGYLNYEKIQSSGGQSKIFKFDYNNDQKSDLLIYGLNAKKVAIHSGTDEHLFAPALNKFFFYPITDIKPFRVIEGSGQTYLILSRGERIAALISFTPYGTLQLLNVHKMDSYPENILIGDLDNNGTAEALVYGKTFDGISRLDLDGYTLTETSLEKEKLISAAALFDVDYDEYLDLVAFNILNNELEIYYNNRDGILENLRNIKFQQPVNLIKSFDINSDDYTDLICAAGNKLEIFIGDSVSSFNSVRSLTFDSEIKDIEITDFNNNGLNDIAVLLNSGLSVFYADSDITYDNSIKLFKDANISDISIIKHNTGPQLLMYSRDGNLSILNPKKNIKDGTSVKLSVNTNYFNAELKDKNINLFSIDTLLSSFVMARNINTDFSSLYNIPLANKNNKFKIIVNTAESISLFCYSEKGRFVEYIRTGFDGSKYFKRDIYLPRSATDMLPLDAGEGFLSLVLQGDTLLNLKYILKDDILKLSTADTIDTGVISTAFLNDKKSILYCKISHDTLRVFNQDKKIIRTRIIHQSEFDVKIIPGIKKSTGEFLTEVVDEQGSSFYYGRNKFKALNNFGLEYFKLKDSEEIVLINRCKNCFDKIKLNNNFDSIKKILARVQGDFNIIDFKNGKSYIIFTNSETGTVNFLELK